MPWALERPSLNLAEVKTAGSGRCSPGRKQIRMSWSTHVCLHASLPRCQGRGPIRTREPARIVLVSSHAGLVLTADTNDCTVGCRHHDANARFAARHARSADPAHAAEGCPARLGHLRAHPADFARRPADLPGLALSGAPSSRAPGVD